MSPYVGVAARNHPSRVRKLGGDDAIDDRSTPGVLFKALNQRWDFTLDVAASHQNARCGQYFTKADNGLAREWFGRVWCNPPFSGIERWVQKAWYEARYAPTLSGIAMLLPATRTEQGWWQVFVEPYRDGRAPSDRKVQLATHFIAARHRFGRPPGAPKPTRGERPRFGLVLLEWYRAPLSLPELSSPFLALPAVRMRVP